MNAQPGRVIGRAMLLIAVFFVWGCSTVSPSVKFYTLSVMTPAANDQMASNLKVVVGPVQVSGYLDRPQMVIRTEDNRIRIVEYHRWADALNENIARGLAENLGVLLQSDHVSIHTIEPALQPDYQVRVNIRQFEGWPGDRVRLGAYWTVRVPDNPQVAQQGKTIVEEPVDDSTHPAMVEALSRTIKALSRDIAGKILAMGKENGS